MNAHVSTEDIIKLLNENHDKVVAQATENEAKLGNELGELKSQLVEVEQKVARQSRRNGADVSLSLGAAVVASDQFKNFVVSGATGKVRIETKTVANITSGSASGGSMIAPDVRPDPVLLPKRRFVLRDLIAPGQTSSNLVEFPQQTARQLNAAPVAETAAKPQSDASFQLVQAPVRTIAHWMRASRQALDDAPLLQSMIDGELRYGLDLVEEAQMLTGDGSGQNLSGIIPQASAFSAPFAIPDATYLDQLLQAVAQIEQALYPADAIILNPLDWRKIQAIKDAMGRYLAGGPFVSNLPVAWNLPLVTSLSIAPGSFLVGAFRFGAQVFDRLQTEVLISTEDQDNFQKNLITVRGESRLAFGVKAPGAFVSGSFS